jgi:hypothetical protein
MIFCKDNVISSEKPYLYVSFQLGSTEISAVKAKVLKSWAKTEFLYMVASALKSCLRNS